MFINSYYNLPETHFPLKLFKMEMGKIPVRKQSTWVDAVLK